MVATITITFEGRVIQRELTRLPDYTKAEMFIEDAAGSMARDIVNLVRDERKAEKLAVQ